MNTAAAMGGDSGEEHLDRVRSYARHTATDRDEAEQLVSELYLPNRLDLPRGSAPLNLEVTGLRIGALTAGRLTYGSQVRLRTADAENYHLNIPLRGHATSLSGTGEPVATGPGEGVLFSPGAPADMWWSTGCEQLCLMISRNHLEAELELLLGRSLGGHLTFDFAADLRTPMGQRLATVLDLVADELEQPTDIGRNALLGRHVEGLVLDGLLLGQRHSHSDLPSRERGTGMSASVRRAVELMQERPSEPWTTVRLAAEVHLSVRALQEGFRRDLATPPMTYLRQIRLRRAHDALRAADRDSTTVRAVAHDLGILHLSRFAAAYREAFGETPSQTLNRAS